MAYNDELKFEADLIKVLVEQKGWSDGVIKYPTEKDLIRNWAKILYENNRSQNRLGDYPLTETEMQQVIDEVEKLHSPIAINGFINGRTVSVKRDNPNDKQNFGKSVALKIYDRTEIASGKSHYQIAEQPHFPKHKEEQHERRGDFMLLINGMPLFHIELKKSKIPISKATTQIRKYYHEGIFSHGIFSLVQIFVAMTPEEMVYFANVGNEKLFNEKFFFHWADSNNQPQNDWKYIADKFLSIPMAHEMIGYYTIPDKTDGLLKVMRSYQYYAASSIWAKVAQVKWGEPNQLGGYVWHTTGSGKTLTSFKSAQLISSDNVADKVIFVVDRIELGTQSLGEYQKFANDDETVSGTEDTDILLNKLSSDNSSDKLIVTSIQKLSLISKNRRFKESTIEEINKKRIVFIFDECHRSTFGDMLIEIKRLFKFAVFFGFTGTPITQKNEKKSNTTADIFGNPIHIYTIANGIKDRNVLGFDIYKMPTFDDREVRKVVALEQAKAKNETEAFENEEKKAVYLHFMQKVPMIGTKNTKGIEDYLPKSQYRTKEHQNAIVDDIIKNWVTRSVNGKFHAIFATSSIPEAIEYYKLFKEKECNLKITALFDTNTDIDNAEKAIIKDDAICEILKDYNTIFKQKFTSANFPKFKKDVAERLAHKENYKNVPKEEQLDILIVVNQMLTGFDSKWINTLYLDKEIEMQDIIQAFSRTNRLFGYDKPHGQIFYYRRPHTMEIKIQEAVDEYSNGDNAGIFVDKLHTNIEIMNANYKLIKGLFEGAGIHNFDRLFDDFEKNSVFAKYFKILNDRLESAIIQGFTWKDNKNHNVQLEFDEQIYLTLLQRYKELFSGRGGGGTGSPELPYDLDAHITEISTGKIDADYMNSRFANYRKVMNETPEIVEKALNELHQTFSMLSQEDQKYAKIFLSDFQSDKIKYDETKTLQDYIAEYATKEKDDQIKHFSLAVGLNEDELRTFMALNNTEDNLNLHGRFDKLLETVNFDTAKQYLTKKTNTEVPTRKVKMQIESEIKTFVLNGGFDIDSYIYE